MADKDIFPAMKNSRGSFRLRANRNQELTIQNELEELERKSLSGILASREMRKKELMSDEHKVTRALVPHFKHERVKEKKKTEPMFPADRPLKALKTDPLRVTTAVPPNVPPTREQAKDNVMNSTNTTLTRKYPFCKPETVKTSDMIKPHKTSLGVVPLTRNSMEIQDLKVIMEGKPVYTATDALDDISMANRCESQTLSGTPEPTTTPAFEIPPLQLNSVMQPDFTSQSKPAILGQTGTTLPIKFSERQKPPPKRMTRLKVNKKLQESTGERSRSAKSVQSSLLSGEITLPDHTSFSQYDQAVEDMDVDMENVRTAVSEENLKQGGVSASGSRPSSNQTSRPNSTGSFKSAKALLEEAKRLASPTTGSSRDNQKAAEGEGPVPAGRTIKKGSKSEKFHRGREIKKVEKRKTKSLTSSKDDDAETVSSRPRSEWTVDEIITSLRIQSRTGEMSDADRRIQEIMDQVLSRTSTYLDASEAGSTSDAQETQPLEQIAELSDSDHADDPIRIVISQRPDKESKLESDSQPCFDGPGAEETTEDNDQQPEQETGNVELAGNVDITITLCEEMELDPSALPDVPPPLSESVSDYSTIPDEQPAEDIDIQQVWEDLLAPASASYEDIVSVTGTAAEIAQRQAPQPDTRERRPVYSTAMSFLSSWAPVEKKQKLEPAEKVYPEKTIHHFCTATTDYQLPKELQGIGRKYHTPGRYEKNPSQIYRFSDRPLSSVLSNRKVTEITPRSDRSDTDTRRQSAAATRILEEAYNVEEEGEEAFEMWQERAEEMFTPGEISIEGRQMDIKTDESRLYWTPAPPRLDVPPAKVQEKLFPLYEGRPVEGDSETTQVVEESSDDSEEEELVDVYHIDSDDLSARDRTLARQYTSYEDLTDYVRACREREESPEAADPVDEGQGEEKTETEMESDTGPSSRNGSPVDSGEDHVSRMTDMRKYYTEISQTEPTEAPIIPGEDDILPVFPPVRKTKSVTRIYDDSEDALIIPNDFSEAMVEIHKMKEKIQDLMSNKHPTKTTFVEEPETIEADTDEYYTTEVDDVDRTQMMPQTDILSLEKITQKAIELTPAEQALEAGRAYVILPKKKKKRVKAVDMTRVEAVQNFLSEPANKLTRSISRPKLTHVIERELRVPFSIRSQRRASLPTALDFDLFSSQKGRGLDTDTREWVRDIWNMWFDQVFPPSPDQSDDEGEGQYLLDNSNVSTTPAAEEQTSKTELARMVSLSEIQSVECLDDTEENMEVREILLEEVARLTEIIESMDKPRAFDIGRRGAIYRKLGKLKLASEDINRAIQMEPLLLDAYWHRHLISLVLGKRQAALDDLTFILKHKKHAGAYRSMAEVFREQGEITMAIVNYTQAIKLNPQDHEAYTSRAEMYERRGEMRLALEDYSKATKLQPNKTDAVFKHGMYYFNNEGWNNAINDFTDLLKVEPTNSQARMYRGRAYAKQGHWNSAVADLSGAIHMDPNNWQAYYHRGCILRRAHAQRALMDFSLSLLINDTEENLMSYLHRGILYNALDKPEDAVPDFEALIKLDNDISVAHINLGLIYMKKFEDYNRAIKKFTSAIKVDPTCVRAIVCRAECYHKIHDLKNALKDFTRAIHLRPDVHHYYMHRGQLVLQQGNLELAAFCVRHASELGGDENMVENSTQQAVVQSFLRNYDKAVEVLMAETRIKPLAPVFMLLGKTQMKAKSFKDAIESFERALALYKPWSQFDAWPVAAAEAHFLIGSCQTELRSYSSALDAFNSAIRINSHHAEALYQRGLTRITLKQSKGIQDFNRALALNPKLFQVYLSRACYYGLKGKHAKAILNCNEALKLQPHSVRAYLYRGALKYYIKAYDLAIRDLSIAVTIDNTCSLAYFNRAVCYQEDKQYEKALTDYGIVLLLGDDFSLKVLINRGLLYFERGDYTNALYDFKMAAKLNPWNYHIHHSLGLCYHKINQLQESVVAFTKSLVENPFFLEALVARGNVYMDYGHEEGLKQARSDYQRVLMLNPNYLSARVNLAYSLQMRGHLMQAWKQFTAGIAINSSYRPALEGRAIVNLQMSDTFAAYQDISGAINVAPTAELYTNRGVINQFMKDGVNAMKDYHLALKKDPTYSLAYFNAANIHFHTRHFKQALDYYSKAIQYNSRDESAYLNRAITKVMLRDSTSALEDFKLAVKLSPYSAHIYFNRGNLYASMQKYDKAETDYNKALSLKPDDPLVLKRRADVKGKLGKKVEAIEDYRRAVLLQSQPELH